MPVENYPWVAHRRSVTYDALHLFVNPNGYNLSNNVWRAGQRTRNSIDRLLAYHVRNGTPAVDIAKELEQFLKRESKGRTKKPYGRYGSYEARRLARTEITAAFGRATVAAAQANPFVAGIVWRLSPSREQDWPCNCAANSEADQGLGVGVYPVDAVPPYPDHPHEMCTLAPQVGNTAQTTEDIRLWLAGEESEQDYGSLFDLTGLLFSLLQLWGMREA